MQMLGTAISNLHEVDKIIPIVEELGRRHVGYGVTAEHYELVGEALLWTVEQTLALAFTPAIKEAWAATYLSLTKVMTNAAAQVPATLGKEPAAA
jgi:hemoglobin-like flavoprotein